jgi:hypothetical protein
MNAHQMRAVHDGGSDRCSRPKLFRFRCFLGQELLA